MASSSSAVSCYFCQEPVNYSHVEKEYKNPKDVDIAWMKFGQKKWGGDTCVKLDLPNTQNSAQKCAHVVHAVCLAFSFNNQKPQCPQCKETWEERSWSLLNQNANSTEQFCNDEKYRIEQLKKNSWFTQDAALNQKLFLAIQANEYSHIDLAALPEPFFKDICALLKNHPYQAAAFFSEDREGQALSYLENEEIAKHYGQPFCKLFPRGLYANTKKTPELQEKLLKAVMTHFTLIPHKGTHDRTRFVCNMLQPETRFKSPEERTCEHTKTLHLLHDIAFDWDTFFSTFHSCVEQNDKSINKYFISLYVRDALNKPNAEELIKVLFGPGKKNMFTYSYVVSELTQNEKTLLKKVLISMKVYDTYAMIRQL